jgi:hypothetical protein
MMTIMLTARSMMTIMHIVKRELDPCGAKRARTGYSLYRMARLSP